MHGPINVRYINDKYNNKLSGSIVFCNTYPKPKRCVLESLPDSLKGIYTVAEGPWYSTAGAKLDECVYMFAYKFLPLSKWPCCLHLIDIRLTL